MYNPSACLFSVVNALLLGHMTIYTPVAPNVVSIQRRLLGEETLAWRKNAIWRRMMVNVRVKKLIFNFVKR